MVFACACSGLGGGNAGECSFVDVEGVRFQLAAFHIEYERRVDGLVEKTDLEVQVAAIAPARVTTQTEEVARLHVLTGHHVAGAQVGVQGLQAVEMAHHHHIAEGAIVLRDAHHACESALYGVAGLQLEVQSIVHASFPRTETGGHVTFTGHGVITFRMTQDETQGVMMDGIGTAAEEDRVRVPVAIHVVARDER